MNYKKNNHPLSASGVNVVEHQEGMALGWAQGSSFYASLYSFKV